MATNISKQGVAFASGNVNPNLLKGSYMTLTQTTDGSSYAEFTIPDISGIVDGVKLVVSVDIELYNVASMSRIGCEPSFPTSGGTRYIGVWTSTTTSRKKRIFQVYTMQGNATSVGQHGIYIQGVTFGEGGGYIKLSNPKLEFGIYPTPWVPHTTDDIYVGNTNGFFEITNPLGTDANIAKEYMSANQFYEL